MEEIVYYFNGDLEHFLSSKQSKYSINFNKFNQEFEFLVSILEKGALLCSNRDYSLEYKNHLKRLFGINLKTTVNKNNVNLWCCDIYDLEFQKKINSRLYTQSIANKYNEFEVKEINCLTLVEENFLYKKDLSVSGSGNFLYPKDKIKIEKQLERGPLLKDKLYKREFDVSTLVDGQKIYHYQNFVDDYFQYKGSLVGEDLSSYEWFSSYEKKVHSFINQNIPIKGTYSIDSFISDSKVIFMSEINNRKTMGYIAHRIKEKFFSESVLLKTLLIPNKRIKNKSYELNLRGVELISPIDNTFGFYIVTANSMRELKEREYQLYNKLFD